MGGGVSHEAGGLLTVGPIGMDSRLRGNDMGGCAGTTGRAKFSDKLCSAEPTFP